MSKDKPPKARRAKKAAKPPLPDNLRPLAAKAIARHMKRNVPPKIMVEGAEGDPTSFASPYRPEDGEAWEALLFEGFGTRSVAVMRYFIGSLADLVKRDWDHNGNKWRPSQDELDAMIAIISSTKPRNESQAALAAMLCTVHLTGMRLAKTTTNTGYSDPRTVAVLCKSVRTYGDGLLTLERLQGKQRSSRQTIKVESHKHVHQHIHYGGGSGNGGRPQATGEGNGHNQPARTALIEASGTVPGDKPGGEVVRLPCREGQEGLPDARGREGKRRADGRG